MAEIFPDEGLDYLLSVVPGGAAADSYVCGLFTSQTGSTVPDRDAVLGSESGVVEVSGSGYERVAVGGWGSLVDSGAGRQVTAAQVTFPTVGSGGWGTINGFFIATTAGVAVFYANFDDLTPITSNVGDVVKVTPFWRILG